MPSFDVYIKKQIYKDNIKCKFENDLNNEIIDQILNENNNRIIYEKIIDNLFNENNNQPFNETEWLLIYDLLEDEIQNIFNIFINMGFEIVKIFQVFVLIPRLSQIRYLGSRRQNTTVDINVLTEILISNQLPNLNITTQFWKQFKPELCEIVIMSRNEQKNKYIF